MSGTLAREFVQSAILNPKQDETCSMFHPGVSCNAKSIQQFTSGCKSVYKMYLIVHLFPILLFKFRKLKDDPKKEIIHFIQGFLKSLLFAGGYSFLVRRFLCLFTWLHGYKDFYAFYAGLLAGITLIFQPPSRQCEVALYTLNKSMEVSYLMGKRRNMLHPMLCGSSVLLASAIGILAYHYLQDPEVFKSNYRKIMDKMLRNI